MNKKLLSLALCVVMLASVLPLEAFAADIVTDPAPSAEAPAPVCTCETACAPAARNAACPVCSAADASEAVCAKYVAPVAPLSAPGGDEETSPSPTVTTTPEPTPTPTSTPEPTPIVTPEPTPTPAPAPDPDRAARIAAVQALIDALPTPDAFSALAEAELEAATAQVSAAVDAYDALSSDEQAEINAEALFALFALPEDPAEELEGETAQNFQVGEAYYATIDEAINVVAENDTIKVNADNLNVEIPSSVTKAFTLDLNGKAFTNVTVSGGSITLTNASNASTPTVTVSGGNVTITGSNTTDDFSNRKFTVTHLVVSGGTVNFDSGIINSVDVSDGELNINGGYIINNNSGNTTPGTTNGNGVLTLTGGTANITGGLVLYVNLGLNAEGTYNGELIINTATASLPAVGNYVVGELHYYGGTLNFGRNLNFTVAAAISALKVNNSGLKQNLSNGSFDEINIISGDLTHLDLLAPDCAFSDKDGKLVDASNSNNLTNPHIKPYFITSHTCKYNATTGKCACGRSSFVAVVEYDGTNIAYPYSKGASQADLAVILNDAFTEAATHPDCTVKLMTDVAYNSEVSDEEYSISSGTFTLDLSGHSLGDRIRIKQSANVTITNSGSSGTVSRLYISNNNPVCTVTGGTFNTIQCDSGTLNFQNGAVSGTGSLLRVTGGTANITGGTIDKLETTNSAVLNVSNTTSTPTIKTLTYQSGTVSLTGGEYTMVTTAGSTGLMCIDLCAENYAFFTKGTGESGDSIAYAANITLDGSKTNFTYLVKESTGHECTYDKTAESRGKCTGCGRECPHTALNENSVCDACGVEFLAEVTYTEGESTKKEIFRDVQKAINKAAAKNGTVTLLANSEASELKFESGTYTLDLNGFTLSCLYGEAITVSGNYVTLVDKGNITDNALIGDISISGSRTDCKLTVDGARVGNNNNPTSITVTQGELEVKPGSTVTGSVTVKSAGNTLTVSGGIFNGVNGSGEVKIDNGKATVSGGTFNVPFIVTGDNPNSTTLSGGTFSSLQVASEGDLKKMLAKGYVYYDNTDNPKPLSDITGTTLSNVTVKKCTHDNLTGTKCEYCGQTFAVKATYGTTMEYYTAVQLESAYTAAGSQNRNGTVTLLTDVTQNSSLVNNNLKFTLDLSGHNLTFSSGSFNVFGDITITDSTTGETKGKLNTVNGDINVTGKLTLSGAEIVISGARKKLEVKDGGALTVNSGTIKGDVNVTDANSALTVSGGTFAKSSDSNGFVSAGDGTKVIISGGTFSEDTTLQIYNSEVELSGGKFGTINATGTNTLPGILKANYEYKYYAGEGQIGKWTNGESLTVRSIYRVEVKPIPIGTITITPSNPNPTYGEPFTLNVVVKGVDEKTVTVPDDGYKWYRDGKYVTIDNNKRDPAKFTPDEISRQAGERTYRYEATVDGYTKSQEITLTIKKAELTDEQKGKITPPKELTDITYSPVLSDGAYTGEGAQRDLFGGALTIGERYQRCYYEYSFDGGETWSSEMGRSDAGTYDVLWRVNSQDYEIYTPTDNKITGEIKPLPVSFASVTDIKDKNKPYDGTPDLPQQTTPPAVKVSYKYDKAGALIDKTFALRPADYALKLEYAKESGGNYSPDSAVGTDKPILATLTLKNSNFVFDDNTKSATSNTVSNPQVAKDGQDNLTGTIAAATLTITAVNKTAYVGDPVPSLDNPVQGEDFIVTGLAKGDTLESLGIKVKLVYVDADGDPVTPDMTKPGTYWINPEVPENTRLSNYGFPNCIKGTLKIEEAPEYTITASAGLNGSISPSGAVKVKQHQSQTFVITPNTGYVVANVKVDGVNLGSIRTYTFTDVKDDGHTIEATFMRPWGNPQTGVDVG